VARLAAGDIVSDHLFTGFTSHATHDNDVFNNKRSGPFNGTYVFDIKYVWPLVSAHR